MSSTNSKSGTPLSRFVLIFTNVCFVVAGILTITYAIKLNNSGWLDVFKQDLPWIQTSLFACMIALGCVAISIACIGCIGASFKQKGLLCCYNIFVLLAFIFVFLVMAGAFASMYLANGFSEKPYPASEQESFIADNFNQVYCYAQAAYLCNDAPASDVLDQLIGIQLPDSIKSSLRSYEGLNDVCGDARAKFLLDNAIADGGVKKAFETACQECGKVEKYHQYEAIYSWVGEQCPLTDDTMSWCGNFLFEDGLGETYNGAPYGACRTQFLSFWSKASQSIGFGMVGFLAFLLVVIISSCVMIRHRSRAVQDEVPKEDGGEICQDEERQQQQAPQAQPYAVAVY